MPDQLVNVYLEKGFFAAIGFILTAMLTIVGIQVKSARDFRAMIHSKIDKNNNDIHKRVTEHQRHVAENYPDKSDFSMMMNNMNKRFDSLDKDVREIRKTKK